MIFVLTLALIIKSIQMTRLLWSALLFCFPLTLNAQKIFSTDYAHQSEVQVFVTKHAHQADLLVFRTQYAHQAKDNRGLWFFTEYSHQADRLIFFVEYAHQADLLIHFVDYAHQTRWQSGTKKHLMFR